MPKFSNNTSLNTTNRSLTRACIYLIWLIFLLVQLFNLPYWGFQYRL